MAVTLHHEIKLRIELRIFELVIFALVDHYFAGGTATSQEDRLVASITDAIF